MPTRPVSKTKAKKAVTKRKPKPKMLEHVSGPVAKILEQRPLITGEEPADYDDLLAHIATAVKPKDAVEWIWVKDVVDLVWEAQRLRRLRAALLMTARIMAMSDILRPLINQDNDIMSLLAVVGDDTATKTAKGWTRGETEAVEEAEELLEDHGLDIDAVMAKAFVSHIKELEQIERMMTTAEIRRDKVLNEIENRRDAVAWRLRKAADNVIDIDPDETNA